MNRETIDRIKKTVQQLAPELEVLKGEKGDKGDSISWKGAHRKDAQYLRFDVVTHGDAAWLATERTKAAPPYAPWVMMCRSIKGERGEQGAQGVQGLIGKQGPEGPQGARGEPGMVWTGAYQSGRQYAIGDVVSLDGSAYVAVSATAQSPDGGAGWQVLVRRGDTGTPGPRGPKGETGATGSVASGSSIAVTSTTASTSPTTGALTVAGGTGIAGAVFVGGAVDISSTTASSSSTTGALIVDGGAGIAKDSFINGVRVGRGEGNDALNTIVSTNALSAATGVRYATAVGVDAMQSATTGDYNTALGYSALNGVTSGTECTAIGVSALESLITGNNNTACGVNSLFSNTASNNTAIGHNAGFGAGGANANTTGSNNTFIGYQSVGASATADNVITLGNSSIATLRCQVTTISSLSDARDKTNIEPLAFGLDLINALNPVSFTWNMRQPEPKDGEPVEVFGKVGIPEIGFIAQELQAAQQSVGVTIPGLVSTVNPDRLEAAPGTLLPVLIKAVQQLSAQVTALQAQVAALEG